jgi:hypothetical protein
VRFGAAGDLVLSVCSPLLGLSTVAVIGVERWVGFGAV